MIIDFTTEDSSEFNFEYDIFKEAQIIDGIKSILDNFEDYSCISCLLLISDKKCVASEMWGEFESFVTYIGDHFNETEFETLECLDQFIPVPKDYSTIRVKTIELIAGKFSYLFLRPSQRISNNGEGKGNWNDLYLKSHEKELRFVTKGISTLCKMVVELRKEQSKKCEYFKVGTEISELLNSPMQLTEILHEISIKLEGINDEYELFLDLISKKSNELKSYDFKNKQFERIYSSESISSCVIKEKKNLVFVGDDISKMIRDANLSVNTKLSAWVGIPLFENNRVIGVFGFQSLTHEVALSQIFIELFESISKQLASTLSKVRKDRELRMLNRSMEQSPASIVITDLDGNIEYVNPKFCEISGYEIEEVIGQNPRLLKSGYTSPEVYKELWETIVSGKEWSGEFLNIRKNKQLYWERARFSAIKDEQGCITNFLAIKEDISEHKNFEKQLLEAKNKAEKSDKMKSAFMANMSHELRTPLNAVIGFSNLCNENLDKDQILEFVDLINKSGNQLLGVVEDILNFTAVESEDVDLNDEEFLMSYLLEEVKAKAREKQILKNKERLDLRFKPDENYEKILVKADYQRVLLVVMSLIKNGLKFTNEGFVEFGYIVVDETIHFYVEDSGVGINSDQKEVIFDSFRQVDDSITRTYGGTGLGLAITKKIVDKMGGRIIVESKPKVGSRFTIQLDCIISKKEKMISETIASSNDECVILVAEDELSNYRLIEAILKRNQYSILRAKDGEEAIEACRNNQAIKLVLMDIRMPDVNGLEATKVIKSFRPDLPIIAQTAYAMDGDKDKAMSYGCDDYISKPIRKEILLEKMHRLVQEKNTN